MKNGFYLKNPPDFISNDFDIDVNCSFIYAEMEKLDEFCLMTKKEIPSI